MRQGIPRGFLLCIKISQLTTAMKKMHPTFLLNLVLSVGSELQEARGPVGSMNQCSLLEESCCKNHIKSL